jgi:hypothetical protein
MLRKQAQSTLIAATFVTPCFAQKPAIDEQQPWSVQYAAAQRQTNAISMLLILERIAARSAGTAQLDISRFKRGRQHH